QAVSAAGLVGQPPEFRQQCLDQLRAARKAGVLTRGALDPRELARQAGAFARFAEPQGLLDAERHALEQLAGDLRQAGYPALAHLLALEPPGGTPVLVAAARYFFRRQIETDRQLFQGLAFAQIEHLAEAQETGFAALAETFAEHGQRLEGL